MIVGLNNADWDRLEKNVVERIRMLRAVAEKLEAGAAGEKIGTDLIVPCVALLAEFCGCVQMHDEQSKGE